MRFTTFSLDRPDDASHWDAFVQSCHQGSPFHLTAWIRTIVEGYGLRARLFGLLDEGNSIRAVVPFVPRHAPLSRPRLVCLPFTDYCGPLGIEESDSVRLLEAVRRHAGRRLARIEVRGSLPKAAGFSEVCYYRRHILPLKRDPNEIQVDKRTVVYNIRRARKAGVEIIEDNTWNGCSEFYKLSILTRKKHGIPSQPESLYRSLAGNMVDRGLASVLLAVHESRVVAGAILLKFGDTVYYKYNASDPAVLHRFSPNHLLAWTAIERACVQGYQFFDFGRSASDNEGLMRYKRMWGAEEIALPYAFSPQSLGKVMRSEHSRTFEALKVLWRLLPDPIIRMIGLKVLRYFG